MQRTRRVYRVYVLFMSEYLCMCVLSCAHVQQRFLCILFDVHDAARVVYLPCLYMKGTCRMYVKMNAKVVREHNIALYDAGIGAMYVACVCVMQ